MIHLQSSWKRRLAKAVHQLRTSEKIRELTLDRIRRDVAAPSAAALSEALTEYIVNGEIVPIYRVLSPETKSGIFEYNHVSEIPSIVYDETTDKNIVVQPGENLEIVYQATDKQSL